MELAPVSIQLKREFELIWSTSHQLISKSIALLDFRSADRTATRETFDGGILTGEDVVRVRSH